MFLRKVERMQSIAGNWEGTLAAGPTKLRLVLKISRSAEGSVKATLDSLDQEGCK